MKVIGKNAAKGPRLDADSQRLMRLVEGKRYAEVETCARELLARNGRNPLALRALTFALVGLERHEEVVKVADHALKISPADGEVHNNRAISLCILMRWDEAIKDFQAAIRCAPKDYEIHMNLGSAYVRMHRWNDAVAALLKAIELHPEDYLEAVVLLVAALNNANRLDEAAVCARALCDSHPERLEFLYGLLATNLRCCEWEGLIEAGEALRGKSAGLGRFVPSAWWASWFWFFQGTDHAAIGRGFATSAVSGKFLESTDRLPLKWRPEKRRLKLGYLSADFRNHAVGVVTAELFEHHDRDRVEVFGYSIGENDQSLLRDRLTRAFEHFADIESLTVCSTTDRIRADGIDVLVDLTGWMSSGRVESLALRCAPIQVSWLGYAGTLGHSRLADYIIGDAEVTPLREQEYFTERIVQMPHSYMPADTTRRIATAPSRESQGLPDDAFVICSFNNSYKFNPPLFDLWCSCLRQMPDAVLWLPRHNDTVAMNLKKEIGNRGIASDRLILAGRVDSPEEHLGRLQLADLALDTFPYNSHSTGVDVLWAGVPMVAKRGDTFAGRVGASLLKAVGLSELIADTDVEYTQLVLDLYRDRPRLAALRERLRQARHSSPLFDMRKFARDLESLYFEMVQRTITAEAPQQLNSVAQPLAEPGPAV